MMTARDSNPAAIPAGDLARRAGDRRLGADVSEVLRAMEENRIRRLPVIERHRLVGMISEADLVRHLPDQAVGEFVEAICAAH